eukprot:3630844-Pyramimonas_sp.AAC.1
MYIPPRRRLPKQEAILTAHLRARGAAGRGIVSAPFMEHAAPDGGLGMVRNKPSRPPLDPL